jgi:trehalose 6-phosphate phosphatase
MPVSASRMFTATGDEAPALPSSAALFLDFDGTLAPLASRPEEVLVADWVAPTLARLRHGLDGALAIVSGRPLSAIDEFLRPLLLPGAGGHGVERRRVGGDFERHDAQVPASVITCAQRLAEHHDGLMAELKPSGLALHFRLRPELATLCRESLSEALADLPNAALTWELIDGHCVCELKQRAVSKGRAVRAFLAEAPFAGRLPVFVGDDLTDEDGIRAVQAAGGFGIRVGPGHSEARFRLADTDAVAAWLAVAAAEVSSAERKRDAT